MRTIQRVTRHRLAALLLAAVACAAHAAPPALPGTQPCGAAALEIAGRFVATPAFAPLAHVCKRHPVDAQLTLLAAAWDGARPESKQLLLALLDESRGEVVASRRETLEEDATLRLDGHSLRLDTPPYDLAPGVRAVGLDVTSAYIANCGDGGTGAVRTLYVREGASLRPVLDGLTKSYWRFVRGGHPRCASGSAAGQAPVVENIGLILAMSARSSNGFRDIEVTASSSRDDGLPSGRAPFRHALRYDGRVYPLDALERALAAWRDSPLPP